MSGVEVLAWAKKSWTMLSADAISIEEIDSYVLLWARSLSDSRIDSNDESAECCRSAIFYSQGALFG